MIWGQCNYTCSYRKYCLLVFFFCGAFSPSAARVGTLSHDNDDQFSSVVNPLVHEIIMSFQNVIEQQEKKMHLLKKDNQEITAQNDAILDEIEHLELLAFSSSSQHDRIKKKPAFEYEALALDDGRNPVAMEPRDRVLQTSYLTTAEFELYKNSTRAELKRLWNFTNQTTMKGDRTAIDLQVIKAQITNQNTLTNSQLTGLTTRVTNLEKRVYNITNLAIPTLSTMLQNLSFGVNVDNALLEDKLDNITSVAIPSISNVISTLDTEVDNTRGDLQLQVNATDEDITALSSRLSGLDSAVNTASVDMQSQIDTIDTSLAGLSNQVRYMNNATEKMLSQIDALDSEVNTTWGSLQIQLNTSIGNLSTRLDSLNSELDTTQGYLQNQLLAINQSIDELKSASTCYFSCKEAYDAGQTTSGVYQLCPSNSSRYVAHFYAYCDQVTDGGGWMLFFSYYHIGGQNNPLQLLTDPPLSPTNGYSHMNLNSIPGYSVSNIQDLRFYCQTSNHARKIHFKSSNAAVKAIAYTGNQYGNTVASWTTNYTALANHTGFLPVQTGTAGAVVDGGLWQEPFFKASNYYWSVRNADLRWECDDYITTSTADKYGKNTTHSIWARVTR